MPKIFSEYNKTFPEFKKYFDHSSAESCINDMASKKKGKIVFKFFERACTSNWQNDGRLKNLVDAAISALNSKCPKKKRSDFDSLKKKYEEAKMAEQTRALAGAELHEAAEEMRRQHEKERQAYAEQQAELKRKVEALRQAQEGLRRKYQEAEAKRKAEAERQAQEEVRRRQGEADPNARSEEETRSYSYSSSSHRNSGYDNIDDIFSRFFNHFRSSSSRSRTYAPPKSEEPKIVVQMPEELKQLDTYKNNQNFQGLFKLYEKLNTKHLDIDSRKSQEYMQEAFNVTTLKEAISCWRQLYLIIHPDKIGQLNEESKTFLTELFKFGNHYYSLATAK